jgi:hypothetical protein
MRIKKIILALIFSVSLMNAFSQDSIFIYDIASQSLTQKPMPAYNVNAISDSTNPSFGVHGVTNMPTSLPLNTYPSSNISLLQKASDIYSTFNFPFTASALIRYGFNITAAVIGKRALLVFNYDVRQPNSHWRNLSDANPFYENGTIQYAFNKLTPLKYYTFGTPDTSKLLFAVVEVAENIGTDAGYFGLAFDTTANAYDSLLLYNISYPKKDMFPIYPDSTNGDTLCLKYGRVDGYSQNEFQAYMGGDGEYDSPFFDEHFRLRGIRWSLQSNFFIDRKGFYFLKYVIDSLATSLSDIESNSSWSIFPNPATNNISIRFDKPLKTNTSLIISNILGQTIEKGYLSIGDIKVETDISNLASGIYVITIIDTAGVRNGKFIKQ